QDQVNLLKHPEDPQGNIFQIADGGWTDIKHGYSAFCFDFALGFLRLGRFFFSAPAAFLASAAGLASVAASSALGCLSLAFRSFFLEPLAERRFLERDSLHLAGS